MLVLREETKFAFWLLDLYYVHLGPPFQPMDLNGCGAWGFVSWSPAVLAASGARHRGCSKPTRHHSPSSLAAGLTHPFRASPAKAWTPNCVKGRSEHAVKNYQYARETSRGKAVSQAWERKPRQRHLPSNYRDTLRRTKAEKGFETYRRACNINPQ